MIASADFKMEIRISALKIATNIKNTIPISALNDVTPKEAWPGKQPDLTM